MTRNALRDLFNRVRWHAGARGATVTVAVRVRRQGSEVMEQHDFADVAEVSAGGLSLRDGTFLPFHRVVGVSLDGCPVWPQREAT